jgi:hypothetical protein
MVNTIKDFSKSLASSLKPTNYVDTRLLLFLPFLNLLFVSVCCQNRSKHDLVESAIPQDTLVRSEVLKTKIAGSGLLLTSERFYLIIKNDTSDFTCLLNTSKENGTYSLNLSFFIGNATYDQRLIEFTKMLPYINTRYHLDSLKSIYLGRLIYYGDLAISVTKDYHKKYTSYKKAEDYEVISTFLLQSQLTDDFNKILKPYAVSIQNISPEKIFFADKEELLTLSKITYPADSIPGKILDCMIWLKVDN